MKRSARIVTLLLVVFVFTILSTEWHLRYLDLICKDYIGTIMWPRHVQILNKMTEMPYRYRILPEILIDAAMKTTHLDFRIIVILGRNLIFFSMLLLAYGYFRGLGMEFPFALLGLSLVVWGMPWSAHGSDLSLGTFLEVVLFLAGILAIQRGRDLKFLCLICFLGITNRETFLFFFPVAWILIKSGRVGMAASWRIFAVAMAMALAYTVVRLAQGPASYVTVFGTSVGPQLFIRNIINPWVRAENIHQMLGTLSFVPLAALLRIKGWPREQRLAFWAFVPIYFVALLFGGNLVESRLFVLPQVLFFVPGALMPEVKEKIYGPSPILKALGLLMAKKGVGEK